MNVGSRKTLNMFRNSHRDGKNEIGQHARVTAVNFCVAGENLNRLFPHATIGLKTTASEGKNWRLLLVCDSVANRTVHIWLDSLFIHNDLCLKIYVLSMELCTAMGLSLMLSRKIIFIFILYTFSMATWDKGISGITLYT
ncbi:uncharacterized protein EV154DRAFT_488561 [Mucor mucedo]|uniref:uncharacterized protein n=1 Tax=Mucor mucedo TaxID=29922 RepID=UPI00221F8CC3|nr:uncharacterized protein EV154DRAFT_488561 [Mucor mucedo]KAI7866389.1 hypothetical protein EV154DRAFT_488561 [Mucor mucedo]